MKFGRIRKEISPVQGKTYKVKINGFDAIVRYEGSERPKSHCVTCTCIDTTPLYALLEPSDIRIGAGPGEVEIIEEVK